MGQDTSVFADGTDGSGRASGSAPAEGPRTPLVLPAHRASHSHIFKGHARESQTPSPEVKPLALKGSRRLYWLKEWSIRMNTSLLSQERPP